MFLVALFLDWLLWLSDISSLRFSLQVIFVFQSSGLSFHSEYGSPAELFLSMPYLLSFVIVCFRFIHRSVVHSWLLGQFRHAL